ncbi:MAG TPA: histidine kinase [Chitinophagaceae bacterium]|nr:histidine kinase [Chitinophagaceae bacterium]
MNRADRGFMNTGKLKDLLLYQRWPWHLLFWTGYLIFRLWVYYVTIHYNYPPVFLQYMLLSELLFVATTYFSIWLYRRLFERKKYSLYFFIGAGSWVLYLLGRTVFQFWYLRKEQGFQNNRFTDIFFNNIAVVIVFFLFITAAKYFKDGFISQQFEAEKKQQQLMAEVNNLKSQIAPHFLFNTLNNLYGLAVDKSEKLPDLMLRLSDLLRHSLYETQKPLIPITEEISVLKSYIQLESLRLENYLKLKFDNTIPGDSPYQVAPLLLIVFLENAFKHSKLVQLAAVNIYISTSMENNIFTLLVRNNYNTEKESGTGGIGLTNVKRRLDVLYPEHQLTISRDKEFFTVILQLPLSKAT